MKSSWLSSIVAVSLIASLASCSSSKKTSETTTPTAAAPAKSTPTLTAEDSVLVTAKATVQAIDHATRNVTLKGADGKTVTFTVDKRVQRLNEVKVGDEVTADYYISIAGELRAPTAEEAQSPLVVLAGAARAPKGTEPAAGALQAFRVVTTVQSLDLSKQTVTLRGPGGNDVTIRARSLDNLKKLHVGDTIIVTYTEALAISLQKVGPRN
jgi:hypothetical protein